MDSTILIVEDEQSVRQVLTAILNRQGYNLKRAKNGKEALEIAQQILPDLILLDLNMPDMDGFEVCRKIRAVPPLAEIPIILLSEENETSWIEKGMEAGADVFLKKPINSYELISRIRTITCLNPHRTLLEEREDLREITACVVSMLEDEKKRLSHKLHDDLGQALTTQMLTLRNMQAEFSSPGNFLHESLEKFSEETKKIYSSLHQLVESLRPPVLEALSLETALQSYCTEFTRRTGLEIIFDADQNLPELSDLYRVTLYRVLEEALANITKHAQTKKIWVELSLEEKVINLTVQDNGYDKYQRTNIGIMDLQQRLLLANGKLSIKSTPKQGTILSAQLPLPSKFIKEETI